MQLVLSFECVMAAAQKDAEIVFICLRLLAVMCRRGVLSSGWELARSYWGENEGEKAILGAILQFAV